MTPLSLKVAVLPLALVRRTKKPWFSEHNPRTGFLTAVLSAGSYMLMNCELGSLGDWLFPDDEVA